MLRVASSLLLMAGLWLGLTAFWVADPRFDDGSFAVNTTVAHCFRIASPSVPASFEAVETDTAMAMRILMLNYSAYDSAYAGKLRRCIHHRLPGASLTDFWEGSQDELIAELADQQVVVVAYPSDGNTDALHGYGNALREFVRQGGAVIFTGTHEYGVLQQFDLFDLDFGYFCADPNIHETANEHPVLSGTPEDFTLLDYAYPLDISDPGFVTLADVRGYPVLGYKNEGAGKILYLGFEYYYEEPVSARILVNALRWAAPKNAVAATPKTDTWSNNRNLAPTVRRTEEVLFTGGSRNESLDLKIYPNPYTVKAALEFELTKTTMVAIEMTDETGRPVAELLKQRSLVAGAYHFDLPNLQPGVYFVKCRSGETTTVRKVVKMTAP